jgi:transcriptional regulator with XRE-family HTH domain
MDGLTLGEAIREIRTRRGFSRHAMMNTSAHDGGDPAISETTILRIENGERRNPHVGTLLPICEILDIEIRIGPEGIQIVDLQEEDGA